MIEEGGACASAGREEREEGGKEEKRNWKGEGYI